MNKEPMSIEGYDLLVKEFKFLLEVEKPKIRIRIYESKGKHDSKKRNLFGSLRIR